MGPPWGPHGSLGITSGTAETNVGHVASVAAAKNGRGTAPRGRLEDQLVDPPRSHGDGVDLLALESIEKS